MFPSKVLNLLSIRKVFKIAYKLLGILLLLFLILFLILSIPSVQTALGRYATNKINEEYKTNINIGKIGLQLNGDVELKDIYIEDYKQGTLISIVELNTSILNFSKLAKGKLTFGDIDIDGLVFNIKTYKDEEQSNLDVFIAKFDDEEPDDEPSNFLLSSSDITITNGNFTITNENKETTSVLDFSDINLNTTNFLIHGSDVSTRINTLAFNDSRGLRMQNLSANFKYTREDMSFESLNIKTESSTLSGYLKFSYDREDLQYFTDRVKVDANFTESDIALSEINTFYNEFGKGQRARLSAKINGTLNDLTVNNLKLTTSSRSKIYGDINFKNLFNAQDDNFEMTGEFSNLTSNYKDLTSLLPNVLGASIPSVFDKLGNFTLRGDTHIKPSSIEANVIIDTELGLVNTDLYMNDVGKVDNASYEGKMVLTDFDLGSFLNDPQVGQVSMDMNIDGRGFSKENLDTVLKGEIYSIVYNNYQYKSITVSGVLRNQIYNGLLKSDDPNFKLTFNGLADVSEEISSYDFVADVQFADLKELNFVKNDSLAHFKGVVDMNMEGKSMDDLKGTILFRNTTYQNEIDTYIFDNFAIQSSFSGGVRTIEINSPDIIEGRLSGEFKIKDIARLIQNSLGSLYSNYKPYAVKNNQYIDFNFKIYNKIVEVFYPNIKIGANTYIRGRVENNEKAFNLTFKSPEIKLFKYFAKDIEIQIDNDNPLFNALVDIDSVSTKYYNLSKFNLVNITLNDTMFVRSEFKGGKTNDDVYNLNLYHTFNKENLAVVGFKQSDVTFRNNTWIINKNKDSLNKVVFDKGFKDIDISQILMNHDEEEIALSGVLIDSTYKDIHLNFKDVDIAKITPEIDSVRLKGNVNGKLDILQKDGVFLPNSSIIIDDLDVNDTYLGSFKADIKGDQTLTRYDVNVSIKDEETPTFLATGSIDVADEKSYIDVMATLDDFNLEPLNPFGGDVITNIRGSASGQVHINGNLKRPSIDGNLKLEKSGLLIPYLNVDLDLAKQTNIRLSEQRFIFEDVDITDTAYETKGKLNGEIRHNNFSNWELDLALSTNRLLVLNTEDSEDALYYGKGFIKGRASITGPTEELVISVNAQTMPGTDFKIPLNDSESFGDNTFINFLSPEEKIARQQGILVENKKISGLELNFDLDITQDAQIELVMDRVSGSTIKGRGEGALLIDINTNGKFNIFGDFSVFEGVYNFLYGGIIKKQFRVKPGSSLSWDGDPLGARIDITAIYHQENVNPSALLDSPTYQSIPVDLNINLTGELKRPDPDFTFEFPNVSTSVKSELDYKLESKQERDNQALYLLATNSFSGAGTDVNLSGTISERISGIVNNILGDGPIGLNYEAGQNNPYYQSSDELIVTLQTKLSDRVIVNGNVGVPVGGVNETVIAGDVQVDVLLNEEGSLVFSAFNRENSIRYFGEEIGYTQGIGITYSVDFDTFKELIQKIFKGKVEVNDSEEEKQNENQEQLTPEFINFTTEKKKE